MRVVGRRGPWSPAAALATLFPSRYNVTAPLNSRTTATWCQVLDNTPGENRVSPLLATANLPRASVSKLQAEPDRSKSGSAVPLMFNMP